MPEASDLSIEPLDIIAVGAHPDDVEIGCGGTLAKLVEQGYRVGIVDLTDGEPTPGSPSPDVRKAEAMAAADILGVHHRTILDLPNRRLFDDFDGAGGFGQGVSPLEASVGPLARQQNANGVARPLASSPAYRGSHFLFAVD